MSGYLKTPCKQQPDVSCWVRRSATVPNQGHWEPRCHRQLRQLTQELVAGKVGRVTRGVVLKQPSLLSTWMPRSARATKMRAAYHADSALLAQAQLEALARELDKTHPRVAASLRRPG